MAFVTEVPIGAEIRRLRMEADLKTMEVCLHMAAHGFTTWTPNLLNRQEQGKRHLLFTEALELADLFGVDVSSLGGGQ